MRTPRNRPNRAKAKITQNTASLSLEESFSSLGVTDYRIARAIDRGLKGKNALKAADMLCKIRGLYVTKVQHGGQINHAHATIALDAPLNYEDPETKARLKALEDRKRFFTPPQDALDLIAPPKDDPEQKQLQLQAHTQAKAKNTKRTSRTRNKNGK